MKRRRSWKIALVIAVPLLLFAVTAERNRWRPHTILPPDKKWRHRWLQFSPDGRYLDLMNSSRAYAPAFYEPGSGRLFEIKALAGKTFVKFVSNNRIASSTHIQSFPDGKLIAAYPEASDNLGTRPDGKTLLTYRMAYREEDRKVERRADRDVRTAITTWDFKTGRFSPLLWSLPPEPKKNTNRNFYLLADKRTLVIEDVEIDNKGYIINKPPRDKRWGLKFWDIEKQKVIFSLPATMTGLPASTANGLCAFSIQGRTLEVWNYKTGRQEAKITYPPTIYIASPLLSPDGPLLAVVSTNKPSSIDLWDIQSGKLIRTLKENHVTSGGLSFSPDGRTLASNGDGGVKLWRIK